ncbi:MULTISPECIES: RHS repeat-associated core domain-containing protein [Myroides]|nr:MULTISPECIES: RHS repeat-associated core domain-containing protein [Myroides]
MYGRCIKVDNDFVPFLYQGQYDDLESGLYYNRFRYYSPDMGMYVSQDPIGLMGGMALYGYVGDVNGWLDPFGLSALGGG